MKIAICGSHPATKMKAPFGEPDWQIWACSPHNYSHGRLPRVNEWFELHTPAHDGPRYIPLKAWEQAGHKGNPDVRLLMTPDKGAVVELPPTRPMDYLEWVRDEVSKEIPVWVRDTAFFATERRETVERPERGFWPYPEDELKRRFSPFPFTSSIAYMMAKAIAAEPEALGLFGIVQASPNEFSYQRPGIQFLINEAHRAGIEVVAPHEARLFDVVEQEW